MAIVKRIVRTSHPAAFNALKALAAIVGLNDNISVDTEESRSDSFTIEMTVVSTDPFSRNDVSYSVSGFLDCTRAICKAVPDCGLWGQVNGETSGEAGVESWVERAVELITPAYVLSENEAKDAVYKRQVEEFVQSVDKALTSDFLVGKSATAADVVVSILVVEAASRTGASISNLTGACALFGRILSNAMIVDAVGNLEIPSQSAASTETAKDSASAVDFSLNDVVKKLNELSIAHNTYSHKLSTKVEELITNVPLPPNETHTKNVFFKDKKYGLFLVCVKPEADVNTKALATALNLEGKVNLRLANEDLLMEKLGVKTGCVGPLSMVNNKDKDVTLVLDEALFAEDIKLIHSHPLTNDASTALTPSDLKNYLAASGIEPVFLPFESKSGNPVAGKAPANRPPDAKTAKGQNKGEQQPKNKDKKTAKKGETLLALQWKKDENFAMWYSDVIVLSEMISYYDISGCYILRPWSYKIWDMIQNWFNLEIEKLGVENAYFPLFVSQDRLEKEKDHVEGFAPEVAWVTKSGDGELAKPIAIRPTSETIMYPAFSDWIRSHRDLPLKLNQWSNVVRWEFKDPTPFLRSREFLWQEGHTAHATFEDANVMVMQALELYRRAYEEILAVPVIPGYKTEKEKFAGGHQTTTVEAYIAGSGRAIQGATSHNLGQNFGKMFNINFQDENGKSQIAWQTSWGFTTRAIGVMIMVHGDNQGLVMPPRIAPLQVVIVPIIARNKMSYDDAKPYCEGILQELQKVGIRAKYDDRTMYNPGWKYNHWEQKGVPIRIEVGPRDIESKQVRIVTRYNGDKEDVSVEDIGSLITEKLASIQNAMFEKAKQDRDQHVVKITEWKDFVPNLEQNNLVLTPWCGGEHQEWEEWVKEKSREESLAARGQEGEDARTSTSVAAKTLCIPFDQPDLPEGTKCFASGLPAKCWVLWGRSY